MRRFASSRSGLLHTATVAPARPKSGPREPCESVISRRRTTLGAECKGRVEEDPIDITDELCFDVLVACVCSRRGAVPWRRLRRNHGHKMSALRRLGRQRLGIQRWTRQMLILGELPWAIRPLKTPRALDVCATRQVVRGAIAHVARGSVWRAQWLRNRLRPVRAPERTYSQTFSKMSPAARAWDTHLWDSLPQDVWTSALACRDLQRVKRYWGSCLSFWPRPSFGMRPPGTCQIGWAL